MLSDSLLKDDVILSFKLDAISVINNGEAAEVFDLKTGEIINTIMMGKDKNRLPYIDVDIVTAKEDNFTYTIMTNNELRVFEKKTQVWSRSAAENETFVFVGYNYEQDTVVLAISQVNSTEINVYSLNNGYDPSEFIYNPYSDILLKTSTYALALKMPPYAESTMIIAYSLSKGEMIFNKVATDIGPDFQVYY